MARDVAASCEQQRRLIDALLQLTLGRRGLTRLVPIDIPATIAQALRAHDLSDFQTIITLKPARTTGDPVLIERLAANLISNAARHNHAGGRIAVGSRTESEHAVLSVTNTGRLIPTRELTRVFEPFHRVGTQPQTRDDGLGLGLGLGLAIVRAIADAHHATITAHAQADGGLTLDVRFHTTT